MVFNGNGSLVIIKLWNCYLSLINLHFECAYEELNNCIWIIEGWIM